MKAMLTAASAAILFVMSNAAIAAEPDLDTRTATVDYSSLDLTHPAGVAALEHRVSAAVSEVCGGPAFALEQSRQQRACEEAARTSASRQVQDAIVSARQGQRSEPAATSTIRTIDRTLPSSVPLRSTTSPIRKH